MGGSEGVMVCLVCYAFFTIKMYIYLIGAPLQQRLFSSKMTYCLVMGIMNVFIAVMVSLSLILAMLNVICGTCLVQELSVSCDFFLMGSSGSLVKLFNSLS